MSSSARAGEAYGYAASPPKPGAKDAGDRRINPHDQREVTAAPGLRIVKDSLWERVKASQQAVCTEMARDGGGNTLNRVHRRKFLLSGLPR